MYYSFPDRLSKDGIRADVKSSVNLLYRAHQVLHTFPREFLQLIIPVVLPISIFILISSIYSGVRFHRVLNAFILVTLRLVSSLVAYSLKSVLSNAATVTKSSEMYSKLGTSLLPPGRLTKYDKLFFKSCPPLEWRVGSTVSFTVKKQSFIRIMNEIVVTAVVNLLVAF
jgi:hypothetical protein